MKLNDLRGTITRSIFDIGADFYAWLTWQRTWRNHCGSLAEHFPRDPRALRVLDLGIGPGISGIGLLDRRPDDRIIGVDFSRRMLRQARDRVRRSAVHIILVRADARSLPFADASFDVVTHHSFLYLIPDRDRVLRHVHRVLKPGGIYVMLEPNRDGRIGCIPTMPGAARFKLSMLLWRVMSRGYGRFTPEGLRELLSSHRFHEVKVEETLSGLGLLALASRPEA